MPAGTVCCGLHARVWTLQALKCSLHADPDPTVCPDATCTSSGNCGTCLWVLKQDMRCTFILPCVLAPSWAPQNFVHLQLVSQLHAVDGGATYGLPYDQLLPPVPDPDATDAGRGGPLLLSLRGLELTTAFWTNIFLSEHLTGSRVVPPDLERRTVSSMLIRYARATLDSWQRRRSGGGGVTASGIGGGTARGSSGGGGNGGTARSRGSGGDGSGGSTAKSSSGGGGNGSTARSRGSGGDGSGGSGGRTARSSSGGGGGGGTARSSGSGGDGSGGSGGSTAKSSSGGDDDGGGTANGSCGGTSSTAGSSRTVSLSAQPQAVFSPSLCPETALRALAFTRGGMLLSTALSGGGAGRGAKGRSGTEVGSGGRSAAAAAAAEGPSARNAGTSGSSAESAYQVWAGRPRLAGVWRRLAVQAVDAGMEADRGPCKLFTDMLRVVDLSPSTPPAHGSGMFQGDCNCWGAG